MTSTRENQKIIGTLVPISALTSLQVKKEDQGTFETGLYFLDWIHETGQNAWQMLPLHQTQLEKDSKSIRVPSPYKGYGIGLDPRYLCHINSKPDLAFRQAGIRNTKHIKNLNNKNTNLLEKFKIENKDWLEDYALFCALRDYFGTDDWRKWDGSLRKREKKSISEFSKKLKKEIDNHILIQFRLHRAYSELKQKAEKLKILLIGDLPFYISVQSPLAWVYQDVFKFEADCSMRFVSGIPDTPSAHFGRQVWGHPIYRWDLKHRAKVMKLWKIRLKYLSSLFDSIRFDHAKAFFDFGEIDLENKNKDRYIKGPEFKVFETLMNYGKKCGMSIFAEDSGENLSELRTSLKKLKTPGIKIFRFALNEKKKKLNREYAELSKYPKNTVAYTTTHDTETLIGYLNGLTKKQKILLSHVTGVEYATDDHKYAKAIINALIGSPAKTIILSIQDWLLTTERINIPGTEKDVGDLNWQFKLKIPVEKLPISLW